MFKNIWKRLFQLILIPVIIYLIGFLLLSYPLVRHFTTAFMGDSTDIYQNVWSLWWLSNALLQKLDLWFTQMLYAPYGVSLHSHALSPTNGLVAFPLHFFFSWIVTYNIIIIFNYVATGLAAFWLANYHTRHWLGSVVSGWIVTFSSYHFFHSRGHMEMAALQWLLFYLLSVLFLFDSPSFKRSFLTSLLLAFVFFNTPYHFVYAIFFTLLIIGFRFLSNGFRLEKIKNESKSVLMVGMWSVVLLLPSLVTFNTSVSSQDFMGVHDPRDYSVSFVSYVLPSQTEVGNRVLSFVDPRDELKVSGEASVGIYWSAIILMIIGTLRYYKKDSRVNMWVIIGLLFLIFSIGPLWKLPPQFSDFLGHQLSVPMPYALLGRLIPGFTVSGLPARMGVGVLISVGILAGYGVKYLDLNEKKVYLTVILIVLLIETIPVRVQPLSAIEDTISLNLATLETGILADLHHQPPEAMYLQTIHKKPIIDGYLSRVPLQNVSYMQSLVKLVYFRSFWELCNLHQIRYVLSKEAIIPLTILNGQDDAFLYDLMSLTQCR